MTDPTPPRAFPAETLAAIVLFAFLVTAVLPGLGPLAALGGLFIVAYPVRHHRWAFVLLTAACVLVAFWALDRLYLVLRPFLVALVLAYVLDPVVDRFERARIPRPLTATLLLCAVLAVVALGILAAVGPALDGARALATSASRLATEGVDALRPWLDRLPSGEIQSRLEGFIPELAGWLESLGNTLLKGASSIGTGVSAVADVVSFLIITPVLLLYLLIDIDRVRAGALGLVPIAMRDGVSEFLAELDGLTAAYVRGQLTVSAVTGVLTGGLLFVAHVPHAIALGIATGALNLVPVIGFWISLVLAVATTLFSGAPAWPTLGWVAGIYVLVQQLEGHLISPRVVGREVGLHPVAILMGLIVFGSLFGFVGVLLAVPLTAISKMAWTRIADRYRESRLYRAPTAVDSDGA